VKVVRIYDLENGQNREAGRITWDGKTVGAQPPDDTLLQNIISDSIVAPLNGANARLTVAHGADFLEGLQFQYRSAYLRAGAPEEMDDPGQLEVPPLLEEGEFGLIDDEYHGATPPSGNWVKVRQGPRGGTIWRREVNPNDTKPPPQKKGRGPREPEIAAEISPGGKGPPPLPQSKGPPPLPQQTQPVAQITPDMLAMPGLHEVSRSFRAVIGRAANLSDDQKKSYAEAMDTVLSSMPEAALKKVRGNVQKVSLYGSTDELTANMAKKHTKIQEVASRGGRVNGAFNTREGRLHLDGLTKHKGDVGAIGGAKQGIRGTYAHELGHAVDWGGNGWEHSGSKAWTAAFEREIGTTPDKARLSKYATTSAHEGFAEFFRLVHGTDVDRKVIEKRFPMASQYLKDNQLW